MADSTNKRGRPAKPGKLGIYSRIDKGTVEKLDKIAQAMQPQPTRAQLIELAVQQYVDRNPPKK
jgi:hypothetical protein